MDQPETLIAPEQVAAESEAERPVVRARPEDAAKERLRIAADLLASGDLKGAIDAASRVLVDQPSSPAAQQIIAEARRQQEALKEPARVGVQFDCPISRGDLVLTLDDGVIETIEWDFTRNVVLGIKRGGRGEVTGSVLIPPGSHRLSIRITSLKRGAVGEHTFEEKLPPGSQWQLIINMPKKKSKPSFDLLLGSPRSPSDEVGREGEK